MKKMLLVVMAIICAFGLCACEKEESKKEVKQSVKYDEQYYFLTENGELYVSDSEEFNKEAEKVKEDIDGEKLPKFERIILDDIAVGEVYPEGNPVNGVYCIAENGDVYVKGLNQYGQLGIGNKEEINDLTKNKNVSDVKEVVCNGVSTYFIDNKGQVYTCGKNEVGELGLGHINEVTNATKVEALGDVEIEKIYTQAYDGGFVYTYFVAKNGEVYAVGSNENGELGIDSKYTMPGKDAKHNYACVVTPRKVEVLTGKQIKKISCGIVTLEDGSEMDITAKTIQTTKDVIKNEYVTFEIKSNGDVYAKGQNKYGELGLGHTINVSDFVKVKELNNIDKIILETDEERISTYFIGKNGNVYVSGYNGDGQLGLGHTNDVKTVTKVDVLKNIKDIEVSEYLNGNTYFITTNGEVYASGANENGELGIGNSGIVNIPTKLSALSGIKIKNVSYGSNFGYTIYLSENGEVYVSGRNVHIDSADSTYILNSATKVEGLNGIKINSIDENDITKHICIAENGDKYEIVNYGSGPVAKKI